MGLVVSKSKGDKAVTTKIIENQPFLRQGAAVSRDFRPLAGPPEPLPFSIQVHPLR
jgi:hypothetical protein